MILAEKLFQKLNNLKSKNELKDFFIYFDDKRTLEITLQNGYVSNLASPTHYTENSDGNFLIVWDDQFISSGDLGCASIGDFDDFFELAKKIKVQYSGTIFIPEKGIYPMSVAYSKALADMIDIPEYLLKIADVAHELNQMVKIVDSTTTIKAQEGLKHVYSSGYLDESYSYTTFFLENTLDKKFHWSVKLSEAFPIVRLQEVFSFFGDICNILNTDDDKTEKLSNSEKYDVILTPNLFREVFETQILSQLNGQSILNNTSSFSISDFQSKTKFFGTFSLSYEPLLNYKPGTYRFTNFGLKAQKQYFIKYGKLESPILDSHNYTKLGYSTPTMEIADFNNLKFEGIKKTSFTDQLKSQSATLFAVMPESKKNITNKLTEFKFNEGLFINANKLRKCSAFGIKVSILDLLKENRIELVEFVDGQYGCKLKNIDIE